MADRIAALICLVAVAFAAMLALPQLAAAYHESACPPGSFIDTAPHIVLVLTAVPMMLFLFASVTVVQVVPRRAVAESGAQGFNRRLFARAAMAVAAAAFITTALTIWMTLPSSVCVSAVGFRSRAARFMPVRTYGWNDVVRIEADCHLARYGEHITIGIHMRDGGGFTLSGGDYAAHRQEIASALAGQRLAYDASAAEEGGCSTATKAMLAQRPGGAA